MSSETTLRPSKSEEPGPEARVNLVFDRGGLALLTRALAYAEEEGFPPPAGTTDWGTAAAVVEGLEVRADAGELAGPPYRIDVDEDAAAALRDALGFFGRSVGAGAGDARRASLALRRVVSARRAR